MYNKFYPHDKVDAFCNLAFSVFDINHDGTINFDEYLLAVAATSQGRTDNRLEVTFDMCDISNDGQINQA
ncbi:unnamed protein product [Rotaria sp. Silwood2]|nr:unnamed protein product [Rotaria sp. Silwood2]